MAKKESTHCKGGETASRDCPRCHSKRIWKDGIRENKKAPEVQRYICRDCGYRFSESSVLSTQNDHSRSRQVCAILTEAKNLTTVQPPRDGLAGATELSETKREFAEQLKRDGYAPSTIENCVYYLDFMERKGINTLNPEQVKAFIASQKWSNGSKLVAATYYGIFAKAFHIQWNPPRYRYEQKIPFVPLEKEVDELIASCGNKMATFLRLLKETGARFGEALRLEWRDFDFEKGTVCINNPEKNSLPRVLPISSTLQAMLNSMPRRSKRVFSSTKRAVYSNFYRQRCRLAVKLKNPRLKQIHFHTLRHFFATMLYAKTLNLLKVQRALGHKSILNTMVYTHLIDFRTEEFEVQIATTVGEAKKLGEAGFEHYDTIDDRHLYKKRK